MTSLKNLVKAAHSGHELVVTGPHTEWIEMEETQQIYSDAAIEHVRKALKREYKVARIGRFSPSSVGKCSRRLAYGYAGAPQIPFDIDTTEIVDHGTWTHLKWQAEGLTMGYMTGVEQWIEDADLMIGGSTDASLYDESVFELKSAAPSVFSRVVLTNGAPMEENLDQATIYMMLLGADWTSLVYEDRAYGGFHEFRIQMDSHRERRLIKLLTRLRAMVEADELPEPLDDCVMRQGKVFKGCPYRKVCHKLNTVSEARAAGNVDPETVHQFGGGSFTWPSEDPGGLL